MNKLQLFTSLAVIIICAVACGGQQPKTAAVAQNQITEETITKDILSLPEMQFPFAAVMIVDDPTADQPYFTVKGGSNMDDHFATSFWFHVYTVPEYEIRIYDVALDSEMTLAEWRNSTSKYGEGWGQSKTFDRTTETLTEADLPFTIPSAHEFDGEAFDKEQTYWRSEYMICENGDVVISASPSMNAICVTLAQWDKKGSFTIYKRGIEFSHGEPVEETITNDILSLPEMQFPHAAVMIVDVPTDAEPYFTVKGGSDMEDHFTTSFWFHVYTAPEYEIRIYDIVSDSEMSLEEWRNSKPKYDEI